MNIELLDSMLDKIEVDQKHWDQTNWFLDVPWLEKNDPEQYEEIQRARREQGLPPLCGTAFCLAGHLAREAGWHPVANKGPIVTNGSITRNVREVACELLNIEKNDPLSSFLFSENNSLQDLRSIAEAYR